MVAGSSLFFPKIHIKYVVFVTMALHYEDFDFKLASEAKIQPVFFKSTGVEDLILLWSRVGHALHPIFIL